MTADLILREWESRSVSLAEADVRYLVGLNHHQGQVLTITPGAQAGMVTLAAGHVAGRLRLPSGRQIDLRPKAQVGALLHMLARAGRLGRFLPAVVAAETEDSFGALLTGAVDQFCAEVERLLDGGLLIGFSTAIEDSPSVRGKLDVRGALARPFPLRHRSETPTTTTDGIENRLLRLACHHLRRAALATDALARLRDLDRRLATITLDAGAVHALERLQFTRLNAHYRPALALTEMFLTAHIPTGRGGQQACPAFLVDMERLFERYVTAVIEDAAEGHWQVDAQRTVSLGGSTGSWSVRPDVTLRLAGGGAMAVDAKYKAAPVAADVYQALAYCHALRSRGAALVYPGQVESQRLHIPGIRAADDEIVIVVLGLDLAGDVTMMEMAVQRFIACLHEIPSWLNW